MSKTVTFREKVAEALDAVAGPLLSNFNTGDDWCRGVEEWYEKNHPPTDSWIEEAAQILYDDSDDLDVDFDRDHIASAIRAARAKGRT